MNGFRINAHAASISVLMNALLFSSIFSEQVKVFASALLLAGAMFALIVVILYWFIECFPEEQLDILPCKSAFADYAGLWGAGAVFLILIAQGKMPGT